MSWEELGQRALSWAQEQGTLLWGEAKEPSIAEVSSEVKDVACISVAYAI